MSPSSQITIRRAEAADAAAVARLLHDFNTEFGDPTPGVAALTERAGEMIAAEEMIVMLAGEGPEGLAQLRLRPSVWSGALDAYLEEVYVAPAHRGEGSAARCSSPCSRLLARREPPASTSAQARPTPLRSGSTRAAASATSSTGRRCSSTNVTCDPGLFAARSVYLSEAQGIDSAWSVTSPSARRRSRAPAREPVRRHQKTASNRRLPWAHRHPLPLDPFPVRGHLAGTRSWRRSCCAVTPTLPPRSFAKSSSAA